MIVESFKKSWHDLKAKLFYVIIIQGIILVLASALFLYINNLLDFSLLSGADQTKLMGILYDKTFLVSLLIFALFAFIVNCFFLAMRLALTKAIVQRKPMLLNLMSEGKHYFSRVLSMKLISFAAILIAASIILAISLPLALLNKTLAAFILVVLAMVALVIIGFGLMFRYAIMFIAETSPWNAIKKSFAYFFSHKGFVIKAFLIVVLVSLPSTIFNLFDASVKGAIVLLVLLTSLKLIYSVFLFVWNDVFIFNVFNSNKNLH